MLTLLAFLLTLSILISVHEFGHYWVARRCGVRVLRFALGFGRPLWMRQLGKDGTEFAVCAIPLGGYVKMLDEREAPVDPSEVHRAYNRLPVSRRMLIVLAGPAANFLLAIVLFAAVFAGGMEDLNARLGDVPSETAAEAAGFEPGDRILTVDDRPVYGWEALRGYIILGAAEQRSVTVGVETAGGGQATRMLDLSRLGPSAMDARLMSHLGLSPLRLGRRLDAIDPTGPGFRAGLRIGDEILSINGQSVRDGNDLVNRVRSMPGKSVAIHYRRGRAEATVQLTVLSVAQEGKQVGRIGIGPSVDEDALKAQRTTVRLPPLTAVSEAVSKTWDLSRLSLLMLWRMLWGEVSLDNLGGPVMIASAAGSTASLGIAPFVLFLCYVSIGLGVLNLLPVPLLDGGHFMYHVAELLKGSPVSVRAQEIGQYVGGTLLLMLTVLALYNDLQRLLHA